MLFAVASPASADEAQWIWAREHKSGAPPKVVCHFRKTFTAHAPQRTTIAIAADDSYELYINGRSVKSGAGTKPEQIDISRYIKRGTNVIAARVLNQEGHTAGLTAEIHIQDQGGKGYAFHTDGTWRYNLNPFPFWNSPVYNDEAWGMAIAMGPSKVGAGAQQASSNSPPRATPTAKNEPTPAPTLAPAPTAAPEAKKVSSTPAAAVKVSSLAATPVSSKPDDPSASTGGEDGQFKVADDFQVTEILDAKTAGSLIAMTFNEFGHIVASREGEGLLLIVDKDTDGKFETVRPYCDKVKNVQGLLCLNGDVFATGEGPDGAALYRLSDADGNGDLESTQTILKFRGEMGEHGPHGIVLGPDGLLYVMVGNHTAPETEYEPNSPHRNYYEGDLVGPKYEDPGGHANGIKAPGGVVIRTDLSGKSVTLVAGGFRNAYDLAFNREGELFVHDSDMESDLETPWYRPTRLYHVTAGSEFGWRSGWSKWPDYFVDNLPAIADTGRGSPTGAVVYNHHMFPARYHNALFLGDWSEGRILAVILSREGATYKTHVEDFLTRRPLNVTDLDVGPDGALYFCTGGRGVDGAIYRVSWNGKVPPNVQNLGEGIEAVIRQPQLQSAWCRQEIARRHRDLADQWDRLVKGVARSKSNPWQYRVRALDLMALYGPRPDVAFLLTLSKETDADVRAKAAEMLSRHKDQEGRERLVELLADPNARVRRKAAESLLALRREVPLQNLETMLASSDRREAWAARRLLELSEPDSFGPKILKTDNQRLFIEGAAAMMIAHPSKEHSEAVIQRSLALMDGYVSDPDFIDLLRVVQLALVRGGFSAADAPDVREAMEREFPANHSQINRELVRLLAYVDASSITDRYMEYLQSDRVEQVDKLHLALHLRFIDSGWTFSQREQLLKFYETAATREGGASYQRYVQNVATDFARSFSPEDSLSLLERADEFPTAATGALYNLPPQLDETTRRMLIDLDGRLRKMEGDSVERLRLGLVAIFARSGDADSMAHLRSIWDEQPERRPVIAMGLAQQPGGANWEYLLRSLPVLEGDPAKTVLAMLKTVPYGPNEPEHYRQVILCGLRLGDDGGKEAVSLLEYWTSTAVTTEGEDWKNALKTWQKWFSESYPDHPPAEAPKTTAESKHDFNELLKFLHTAKREDLSVTRGAIVFEKAQCAKCHRHGRVGNGGGPDLTSVGHRYAKREILESILYPSHVISDQYATKTITTSGGRTFTGMVGSGNEGEWTVLLEDGRTINVAKNQVDEMYPVKKSAMPEGLINDLSQQEIADLFEFLTAEPSTSIAAPQAPRSVR